MSGWCGDPRQTRETALEAQRAAGYNAAWEWVWHRYNRYAAIHKWGGPDARKVREVAMRLAEGRPPFFYVGSKRGQL